MARPRSRPYEEKLERRERRYGDWLCLTTPAIKHFLERSDVTEVRFPSGGVWVFIAPTRGFYGATRLEAIEAAMRATGGS